MLSDRQWALLDDPDRGVPTERQGPTAGPAAHRLGNPVAASERSQVAGHRCINLGRIARGG